MSLWDIIVSIFWFAILFAWVWLMTSIFGDIFRDHELSGWGKGLWTLFLIVAPWLGALVYLIARGSAMNRRTLEQARRRQEEYAEYAGRGTTSTADEIAKLANLRDGGTISEAEFHDAKAKVLGRAPTTTVDRRSTSLSSTSQFP